MGVLSGLKPASVFHYFEEICGIPHGSGNVERISDYLTAFAEERKLFHIQDGMKNVIIVKEATQGYEHEPALILQGHMDMVAVKKPDCDINMKTNGLRLAVDGDRIYAEGTSLGGDDGIAVAYALALLDAADISHPRLEVVVTVDEEVGMDGARGIDLSMLKGHRLLNLDSEEEGIFLASCAGGARVDCRAPLGFTEREGIVYELCVEGLQGGHSGGEIHRERGNANCLLGRILYRLCEKLDVGIAELSGGLADNAIPREARALLVAAPGDSVRFAETAGNAAAQIREELVKRDPGFQMHIKEIGRGKRRCAWGEQALKGAAFLFSLPNGVQAMSMDIQGLVETSLNLGILGLEGDEIHAEFAVRSSVESSKYALIDRLGALTGLTGGKTAVTGDYPGWKYRQDSPLRDKMMKVYERMYGQKPRVEAIHAGLECGLLGAGIQDLDCVSIGPDMKDIHTTEETLSISSVARVWDFLVKLLEEKDK